MTLAEGEALALLIEECGEAIQVVGKCLRHGVDSYNPFDKDKRPNVVLLEHELGDILAAIDILEHVGVVEPLHVQERRADKLKRIGQWLHHISLPGEDGE